MLCRKRWKVSRHAQVLCNGKALVSNYPSCPLNNNLCPLPCCCPSTPTGESHGTKPSNSLRGYTSLLVATAESLVTGELLNPTEKYWLLQAFTQQWPLLPSMPASKHYLNFFKEQPANISRIHLSILDFLLQSLHLKTLNPNGFTVHWALKSPRKPIKTQNLGPCFLIGRGLEFHTNYFLWSLRWMICEGYLNIQLKNLALWQVYTNTQCFGEGLQVKCNIRAYFFFLPWKDLK